MKVKKSFPVVTIGNYQISLHRDGRYSCTCPDWRYRRAQAGEDCKHIIGFKAGGMV